jgi:GlcNAc-P-P-Und epimerase
MNKVVVVGGSGFIGSRLVGELVRMGEEVEVLDLVYRDDLGAPVSVGDIRDLGRVSEVLEGATTIFHLAAEHRDDVRPVSLYWDVNVEGTKNLVRAAEEHGVRRIVFTSSVAVYGLADGMADEDTPTNPSHPYGVTKLEGERILQDWADASPDRKLVIVRPTVVFGEGNQGNVRNLIDQIRSGRFAMVGDGENRKSMCYVGNLVPFLIAGMHYDGNRQAFNYVDSPDFTMNGLVDLIHSELGAEKPRMPKVPFWAGLAGGYVFDALAVMTRRRFPLSAIRVRKFCANTRYGAKAWDGPALTPPFSLQEGLRRMIRDI